MVLTYLSAMSAQPTFLETIGPVSSWRKLTYEAFETFAVANSDLIIELESDGTTTIMPTASLDSSDNEADFIADVKIYARDKGGRAPSSSVGFRLPDGSVKSPNASYISPDRLADLPEGESKRFPRLVPDFIVEVVSPSDKLADVEAKVRDTWIANGVRLAWLVDVDSDKLWVYRADHSVELVSPLDREITGEDVLPGFTFDLRLLQ